MNYELKAGARKNIRDNSPKIFFISIIFIVLTTVMSELQFRLPGFADAYEYYLLHLLAGNQPGIQAFYSFIRLTGIPFAILLGLLTSVLSVGLSSYSLKTTRGNEGDHKDLFNGFLFFWKIIMVRIITLVIALLLTCILIIPGIIAMYSYRMAFYILLDDPKKGVIQCIRESRHLMRGYKLDLFLLDLSFIGWFLLDSLVILLLPFPFSLPLVSIWLTPYKALSDAAFYNNLTTNLAV